MNTLDILKKDAILTLGIDWVDAVDACESIEDVETLLRLVLGKKGNVWNVSNYVGKTHVSVRHVHRHAYQVYKK